MIKKQQNFLKKRIYQFVLKLIKFIEKLPKNLITKIISQQLLRSGTSILANYIEGQSSSLKDDFKNFINYCLKSSNESRVWIGLLKDSGFANNKDVEWFLKELEEFSKIFAKTILTIKKQK